MSNKISVITVVYNDVGHIRRTMDSFFAQTWAEKEYIVSAAYWPARGHRESGINNVTL